MFKKLLARLVGGKLLERVEAEEAFEKAVGQRPLRGMTIELIKRRTEQANKENLLKDRPMRKRYAPARLSQDDVIINPAHSYWNTPSGQSAPYVKHSTSSCDDSSSRHHGGYDSHHSRSSYDSGSSDSGSSSSGGCD